MSGEPYVIFGRQYPKSYDAIIIGSGVAGLVCANILARAGVKVLLIEKHYMLGGFCSTFRRKGFVFDAATHFYPLLGNPATLTGKLLKELEIPTEWVKMDPVDQFHIPGLKPFAVPADLQEYVLRLKEWFPEEAAGVDSYFEELRRAYMYGLLYYFKNIESPEARRLENLSMREKVDSHFRDPRLKTLLMADAPHWGSPPERTSFLFDAMLRLSYFLGNYYPKGSSQAFADDMGRAFEAKGGRILKCAGAEQILVEGGKAKGVRVSTVSKKTPETFDFEAPIVVSNGDALHTYRDLIGEKLCGKAIIDHVAGMRCSFPVYLVHIGLKGADQKHLEEVEGYYWSSHDTSNLPQNVFKVFTPTRFDPEIAPPGCQILIMQKITPMPFDGTTDWTKHKEEVDELQMGRLRKILPGIDDQIVVRLSASAMTSYRFTGNREGAMLGFEMSPEQLGPSRLPIYTPIRDLYLTGHWTQPGGGITPVIVSAQRVARTILTGKDDGRALAEQYFSFRAPGSIPATEEVSKWH
ncbi:MAG: NAD(P)/FAD-dependent oxidoreductase [Bryobacteraceae bacterium]